MVIRKLREIRQWMKKNSSYITFVLGAWVVGISMIVELSNPAMTGTQLLMNFFPLWIVIVVIVITVFMLIGV